MIRIETAIYTGTGAALQLLIGGGPDLVLTKRLTGAATPAYMLYRDMPRNTANQPGATGASKANQISDLNRDGVTVGGGQSQAGAPYAIVTIKGLRGSRYFATGRYSMNNTAGRNMSGREGCGFQPDFLHLQRRTDGASIAAFRHRDHVGNQANPYGSAAAASIVQAFLADGFQLGNSPTSNGPGTDYVDWWALRNQAGAVWAGSFDGSGVARSIDVGFRPTAVLAKNRDTADPAFLLTQGMVDGGYTAMPLSVAATNAASLVGFHANGFTVGASSVCNGAGQKILYLALKDGTYYPGKG